MEQEDSIGKTPSLDGPSGAVKSAVGVNDLGNSTADNNNEDGADASPLSAVKKKRLFNSNKRQSTASPSSYSPFKGKAKKKTKESKHSLQNGQKAQGRRKSVKSTKALKNVTNVNAKERPSSPSESPMKAKNLNNLAFEISPIKTRSSQPRKKDGFKITTKAILRPFRPDIFGGRTIALENAYDADDIADHDETFTKAANNKFGHDKITLLKVKDGYLTNDFSILSRLLLEDMLIQCNDDNESASSFRVLLSTPSTSEQISNDNAHLSAMQTLASKIYWHQQRHGELGVHKREIMGTKYHELYAALIPNTNHRAIKEGQLTMDEIEELLNRDGGFELRFEGSSSMSGDFLSDATMKINWRDMIIYPGDIMIFGPRSTTIRSFDRLFKGKSKLEYIHHIHRQFSLEVRGDTEASLALIAAYQTKRLSVSIETEKILNDKTGKNLIDSMSFLGEEQSKFFQRVDDTFKGAIKTCLVSFQGYKEPIVSKDRIVELMEEAQQIFPIIWKALESMREINADKRRGSHLVEAKQMQVFFQLLSLARQAVNRRLIHWAFVQALASYGWGIGKKPQNIACYWGNTCSSSTRDSMMKDFGKDTQQRTTDVLKNEEVVLLCYDNIQRGQERKHQRGSKSSFFVKGTHQLANKVVRYDNKTWDDKYVEMTYDQHQPLPSPSKFPAFENINTTSACELVKVLTNFSSIECKVEPDMSGKRVAAYKSILKIRNILHQTKRCFSVKNVCPDSEIFVDSKIDSMNKIVRSNPAKSLFNGAEELQDKTTKSWNPSVGRVTESLLLGVCGLAEESAKQCGAITLDQLYRVGILAENEDGTWRLAEGWENRRVYLYGDCKTIENVDKFVRDIANRPLSYDDINNQVEVFMDAFSGLQKIPGDWHAGLAMLKSIYTLFYVEAVSRGVGLAANKQRCWRVLLPSMPLSCVRGR